MENKIGWGGRGGRGRETLSNMFLFDKTNKNQFERKINTFVLAAFYKLLMALCNVYVIFHEVL